jgi:uncharacterized protein
VAFERRCRQSGNARALAAEWYRFRRMSATASSPPQKPRKERLLTLAECRAWAERYSATPWSMLALSTAADREASPLQVLRSMFDHTSRLEEQLGGCPFCLYRAVSLGDLAEHVESCSGRAGYLPAGKRSS